MQFKSILLLAASATLAIASHGEDKPIASHDSGKYIVGNCGDPSGTSSHTKGACKNVDGKYCGEFTGMARCVLKEDKWNLFEHECDYEVFSRPGEYALRDAEIMALC